MLIKILKHSSSWLSWFQFSFIYTFSVNRKGIVYHCAAGLKNCILAIFCLKYKKKLKNSCLNYLKIVWSCVVIMKINCGKDSPLLMHGFQIFLMLKYKKDCLFYGSKSINSILLKFQKLHCKIFLIWKSYCIRISSTGRIHS